MCWRALIVVCRTNEWYKYQKRYPEFLKEADTVSEMLERNGFDGVSISTAPKVEERAENPKPFTVVYYTTPSKNKPGEGDNSIFSLGASKKMKETDEISVNDTDERAERTDMTTTEPSHLINFGYCISTARCIPCYLIEYQRSKL